MTSESMDFPQVHICTSQGFRPNVLKDMGLKEDSMKFAQFTTYYESVSLGDIQEVWDNATYSTEEFGLAWMIIEGIESYTSRQSRCLSLFLLQVVSACLGICKPYYRPTSRGNFTKFHLSNLTTDGTNSSV